MLDSDVFAIRGAVAPVENSKDGVFHATTELLDAIVARNRLELENVVFAFFTVTPDLDAAFPAAAARALGWGSVPMMCAAEIPVKGALQACIRVLLLCRARALDGSKVRRPLRTPLAQSCSCCDSRRPVSLARRLVDGRRRRRRRNSFACTAVEMTRSRPTHVYLGDAISLRPDLAVEAPDG